MNLSPARGSLRSVAILGLAASACGTSLTGPDPLAFEDVTWKLESLAYADGSSVTIENPDAFTALFASDERLHAQADCNVCNGSYGTVDSSISISPLGCTRAYCVSAPLDTDYISALQAATSIEGVDGKLLLRAPNVTLTFRR